MFDLAAHLLAHRLRKCFQKHSERQWGRDDEQSPGFACSNCTVKTVRKSMKKGSLSKIVPIGLFDRAARCAD